MKHTRLLRWLRSICGLLLASVICCLACAADEPPPLVLAFSELAPWKTKTGTEYTGAYTEIIRELARRIGRDLRIVECPHPRCMLMMQAGDADLSIGVAQSPEREVFMAYLRTPYRKTATDRVFYVRRGDAKRIKSYEDLRGLHIGVRQSSEYFDRFDEDKTLLKESALTNAANLRKLMLKRLDTVLMPEDQGAVLLAELGFSAQVEAAVYREHDPTPRSVAVSRKSATFETLMPQLEAAMLAMRRDGTLAAIYDKHYFKRYGVTRNQVRLD